MSSVDTLKKAAQSLRDTKPELADALEAMAAQKPVAWLKDDGSDAWTAEKKNTALHHSGMPGKRLAARYSIPLQPFQDEQQSRDAARWRFARRHWGRLMESYEPTPEGSLDRIARIMIADDQQVRDGLAWDVDPESLDAAIDSAIAAGGEI